MGLKSYNVSMLSRIIISIESGFCVRFDRGERERSFEMNATGIVLSEFGYFFLRGVIISHWRLFVEIVFNLNEIIVLKRINFI